MGDNTSTQRRLPNFLIIGAPKCGTTSLYNYMNQHPQIFMSRIKETKFLYYNEEEKIRDTQGRLKKVHFPIKSLEEYTSLFDDATNELVLGEATPIYLYLPVVAEKIKTMLPDAKLLAILRDPAERAFSDYHHRVRAGKETRKVTDAFQEHDDFVKEGFYYPHLKRYFHLFSSEQIKVCLYDDLQQETLSLIEGIYRWLDVDSAFTPDLSRHHNLGSYPRNRAVSAILARMARPVVSREAIRLAIPDWVVRTVRGVYRSNLGPKLEFPAELRRRLVDLYREDILKVQNLIQRDLTQWLTP